MAMKADRQGRGITGSQWQCTAYWQLLQCLAPEHSAKTWQFHTAYVSFRYWIILLLSNIAVPVLGSSMYGTCTKAPVRVAAVQGAAALLILHDSEVQADEAIDVVNVSSSPPHMCTLAGAVHAAGKPVNKGGPKV